MQVLIVEDECLIRMLVCNLLENVGHTCIEAANATEALALLDTRLCHPALLVTDFNLGHGPNGQTLAKEAIRKLPGLPVVFMTGNPECFNNYPLNADQRLVAKPFVGSDLLKAVAALCPVTNFPHTAEPVLAPNRHLQAA